MVVSPAGAEAQSSDAPPAVTIATVLLSPVKVFVLPHPGSGEYLALATVPIDDGLPPDLLTWSSVTSDTCLMLCGSHRVFSLSFLRRGAADQEQCPGVPPT